MRLGKYIPPWVTERLGALGLKPDDIDHYVFHQPSEIMVRKILEDIGVDPDEGRLHARALRQHRQRQHRRDVPAAARGADACKPGDKLVLGSAAAGYSMVMATGEWTGPST